MTDWTQLLTERRLARENPAPAEPHRVPFETDLDRVIFSSQFRRLTGRPKTHIAGGNDYVRDRLAHSLETSRVARTLAMAAAEKLHAHTGDGPDPARAGQVVSAAAAARDLGTPCFGATGEALISDFFRHNPLGQALVEDLPEAEALELQNYDRDAQSFRILARLQGWRPVGGLQLTCATLMVHARNPFGVLDPQANRSRGRRYGFHAPDTALFAEAAETAGLIRTGQTSWARHPLSWLVDAADGICGRIIDLEDAAVLGLVEVDQVETLLLPLIGEPDPDYLRIKDRNRRLTYLRSKAISRLIEDTSEAFVDRYPAARNGEQVGDLVLASPDHAQLAEIQAAMQAHLRKDRATRDSELTAARVIETLLESYCAAFHERETSRSGRLSVRSRSVLATFADADALAVDDRSAWLRAVVDFVAGSTDRYARELADLIRG